MNKYIIILIYILLLVNCKDNSAKVEPAKIFQINDFVVDTLYAINDVRRYGVYPDSIIAEHPKLKIDKLSALLILASQGIDLTFPSGLYNRSFIIDSVSNINLNFEKSIFTGSIKVLNSNNVMLEGSLQSNLEFYTRNVDGLKVNNLIVGSSASKNILGLQIHARSKNVEIKNAIVTDLTDNPENFHNKAAVIIHGHNAEPRNVRINTLKVLASSRNGVYVSGEDIWINDLTIENFGYSGIDNMKPMEGMLLEESDKLSGLWIRNCWNCEFNKVKIVIAEKSNANYSVNLGFGDETVPSIINNLIIIGDNLIIKKSSRTNVNIKARKDLKQ